MAWSDLSGKQKALIVGGGAVVAYLGYRAYTNGGQGVTTPPAATATDTSGSSGSNDSSGAMLSALQAQSQQEAQALQQLAGGIQSGFDAQNKTMQDAFTQENAAFSAQQTAFSQSLQQMFQQQATALNALIGQMGANAAATTNAAPATSAAIVQPPGQAATFVTQTTGNSANRDKSYSTIYTNNSNQSALNSLANQNPGSPVKSFDSSGNITGYAISKAGANGTTDYTSNNYNSAVNAAGGQWLDHKFYSGSYDSSGTFHTTNSSQQAAYNKIVPANLK